MGRKFNRCNLCCHFEQLRHSIVMRPVNQVYAEYGEPHI